MPQFFMMKRICRKAKSYLEPFGASLRAKKLNNTDFTIISNNCWGGKCYEYFGLPKMSPTVGMYIFAEDYIKLIQDLRRYMSMELKMIPAEQSRYSEELRKKEQLHVPVGVLGGDIEIVFLHYKDPEIAKEKWDRRVNRINWDNLIIKFSYMNFCNDSHIHQFEKIQGIKKFCFSGKSFPEYPDVYLVPGNADGQVDNDTFYWNRYIDVLSLLNAPQTGIKDMHITKD